MKNLLFLLAFLGAVSNCFSQEKSTAYYASYDLELVQVKNLKSDSILSKSSESLFEDNSISFSLKTSSETIFAFSVNNKTNSSCKINWDSAFCTDLAGNDMGIILINNGINQDQSQNKSVIAPMSEITSIVIPEGYASFINGKWEGTPKLFNTKQAVMAHYKYGNNRVSIFLPVETQGEIIDYLLEFNINNLEIKEELRITGMNDYRDQKLVYDGHGYYSIGDKFFRYNDRGFHNFLYSTGNSDIVFELRKANSHRIASNVFRPFGIIITGIGIIAFATEGDTDPGLIAIPLAGAGLLITSISFRISYNDKLKLVPTHYKPVR